MINGLFNLSYTAQFVTLMAALLLLDWRTGQWKLIRLFLALGLLLETFGWLLVWKLGAKNNTWVYNINICVTAVTLLAVLSWGSKEKTFVTLIRVVQCIIIAITVVMFLTGSNPQTYNSYTELFGDLAIASFACFLLYDLLREAAYRNFLRYEYFWFANSILVWTLGRAVLAVSMQQFTKYQMETNNHLWTLLNNALNILFYTSFIIAIICRNKNTRLSHLL